MQSWTSQEDEAFCTELKIMKNREVEVETSGEVLAKGKKLVAKFEVTRCFC